MRERERMMNKRIHFEDDDDDDSSEGEGEEEEEPEFLSTEVSDLPSLFLARCSIDLSQLC